MRTLGSILRRLRVASGLTQEQLASEAGISTSHLAHVEAGRREPSLRVLRRLAEALHVWPGLLLAAFLQTEMPDGLRPVFDAWAQQLIDAMNGVQLELPIPEDEAPEPRDELP